MLGGGVGGVMLGGGGGGGRFSKSKTLSDDGCSVCSIALGSDKVGVLFEKVESVDGVLEGESDRLKKA